MPADLLWHASVSGGQVGAGEFVNSINNNHLCNIAFKFLLFVTALFMCKSLVQETDDYGTTLLCVFF